MAWMYRYLKTALRGNEWNVPVRNFGCVVKDDIYRGGLPDEKGYRALRKLGIETVVCLIGDNTELAREHGMRARAAELRWYHLPLSDTHAPSLERVDTWLEWSQSLPLMPIFIHCRGGRHRTGGLVAAYRMAVEGWTNAQAFDEALEFGFYSEFGHEPWEQFIKSYTPAAAMKR
jgi:protein tyrosine/serine phosphatase